MGDQVVESGDQWLAQDLEFIAGLLKEDEPEADPRPVHPLSEAAGDAAASVQYDPITSQIPGLLHAAEDNLHGVMVMITKADFVHTYSEYAMVRAALECSAVAWWVMHPDDRRDRVERSLRLLWRDTLDQTEALGELPEIQARKEKRRAEIKAAARAAGIPEERVFGRLGYDRIMREFSKRVPAALLTWQACSGMVHGRRWAMIAFSSLEPVGGDVDPRMVSVRVTGRTEALGRVLRVARLAFVEAERLYGRRRVAPGNLSGAVSTMRCPSAIRTAMFGFQSLSP